MSATAKVIEHSTSYNGVELITFQLRYPRLVHSEFMTHRVFSRNASSSRAIPVAKMIEQVRNDPAMPCHWGKNQPGMQAREELSDKMEAIQSWKCGARQAADLAEHMNAIGLHKQVANRILEPYQYINVIVTATEWNNFYELRDHEDADPNIAQLAKVMKEAHEASEPVHRMFEPVYAINWHLPYVTQDERARYWSSPLLLAKVSAARCARVSYLTHDRKEPALQDDLDLYDRLVGSRPLHASPVEHQAYPLATNSMWSKNFRGWMQHRFLVEKEFKAI